MVESRVEVHEEDKVWLALSYFGPLAIFPLRSRTVARYVKFHARQGLGLFVLFVIVDVLLALIPIIGPLVWLLGALGYGTVTVLALSRALRGRQWRVPGAAWLIDLFSGSTEDDQP